MASTNSCILCIDNDSVSTDVLATWLVELGYALELAPHGERALAWILANRPGLVLDDVSHSRSDDLAPGSALFEQPSQVGHLDGAPPLPALTSRRDSNIGVYDVRRSEDDSDAWPIEIGRPEAAVENAPQSAESQSTRLTAREEQVLTWVARGKTSAEVAIILRLSERTINFHCNNAMGRLDVVNRTQAVAKAISAGLIEI